MKLSFKLTPRRGVLLLVGVIYLVSFVLPVFDNSATTPNHMSLQPRGMVLGFGALILSFLFFVFPAWLASPLFWLAMVFFALRKDVLAAVLSCMAVALGICYLLLLRDRSMVYKQQYLVGYYVWLSTMAALAVCAIVSRMVAGPYRGKKDDRDLTGPGRPGPPSSPFRASALWPLK